MSRRHNFFTGVYDYGKVPKRNIARRALPYDWEKLVWKSAQPTGKRYERMMSGIQRATKAGIRGETAPDQTFTGLVPNVPLPKPVKGSIKPRSPYLPRKQLRPELNYLNPRIRRYKMRGKPLGPPEVIEEFHANSYYGNKNPYGPQPTFMPVEGTMEWREDPSARFVRGMTKFEKNIFDAAQTYNDLNGLHPVQQMPLVYTTPPGIARATPASFTNQATGGPTAIPPIAPASLVPAPIPVPQPFGITPEEEDYYDLSLLDRPREHKEEKEGKEEKGDAKAIRSAANLERRNAAMETVRDYEDWNHITRVLGQALTDYEHDQPVDGDRKVTRIMNYVQIKPEGFTDGGERMLAFVTEFAKVSKRFKKGVLKGRGWEEPVTGRIYPSWWGMRGTTFPGKRSNGMYDKPWTPDADWVTNINKDLDHRTTENGGRGGPGFSPKPVNVFGSNPAQDQIIPGVTPQMFNLRKGDFTPENPLISSRTNAGFNGIRFD